MPELPRGTVTFLFTDIEGSTVLLQRLGDASYAEMLAEHHRLLRATFVAAGGQEVGGEGDSVLTVFRRASAAVAAAVAAQSALAGHAWPAGMGPHVRMALHTGEPVILGGNYAGLDVHRAARICAAGHGGQILISEATSTLAAANLPEGVRLRDLGVHRLKDLQEPVRIFQVIHTELPSEFPQLSSLNLFTHNLPRQLTAFVGREHEMEEVKRSLSTNRLLTLTGAGGVGKTRLALRVTEDTLEEYRDGAWFVDLAALSDPALVTQTVASVLGVREAPGIPLSATLLEFLERKRLLIVLDNCEHLVTECAYVAEQVLRRCPDVRILATSREPLAVSGEMIWRVPPLSFPDVRRPSPRERLVEYESVRLFLQRAVAIQPTFALTHGNSPSVATVCQRLDGIPLAIELAAARMDVLPVEQIAARLDDRFRLLTKGGRAALPHHQTLRSTIDWSYDLLSEKERIVFGRLSVFPSSFTLEAAEAICAGEGIDPQDVFDLLAGLVSKSLVASGVADTEARCWLLDTIRQYGRGKLHEAGGTASLHRRHYAYFQQFAERGEPALQGPEQAAWLARLDVEHDNFRAALGWCEENGDAEAALRLSGALWWFWYVRGHYREGRNWLERSYKDSTGAAPILHAKALCGTAFLATDQGDFAVARRLLEQSLELYYRSEDKAGIAQALYGLGRIALRQEDLARAAVLYEKALALFKELGARERVAGLLNGLGVFAANRGDAARARALFEESLEINQAISNMRGIAFSMANLGVLASREGDFVTARSLVKESLTRERALGDKRGIASELEALATIEVMCGRCERAGRLLGAADAVREAIGAPISSTERAFIAYDRCLAALSAALGPEAVAARWAEGKAMALQDVLEYVATEAT